MRPCTAAARILSRISPTRSFGCSTIRRKEREGANLDSGGWSRNSPGNIRSQICCALTAMSPVLAYVHPMVRLWRNLSRCRQRRPEQKKLDLQPNEQTDSRSLQVPGALHTPGARARISGGPEKPFRALFPGSLGERKPEVIGRRGNCSSAFDEGGGSDTGSAPGTLCERQPQQRA